MILLLTMVLFLLGLGLSGFFSGSETGFYRATRVRLILNARSGSKSAKIMWWFTNHPTAFIATILVGNNVANYITSLAIVMGAHYLFQEPSQWGEIMIPLLLAPIVFIYGELLPKNLYYQAPNRLLSAGSIPLVICSVLLSIPSLLLWGMNKLLERMIGHSTQKVKLALARTELGNVLTEGHHAGVLRPSQRVLAQSLLAIADHSISKYAIPTTKIIRVRLDANRTDIRRLARRHQVSEIVVEEPLGRRKVIGYVRIFDLYLETTDDKPLPVNKLLEVQAEETYISVLMKMQTAHEPIAAVVGSDGKTVGVVTHQQLTAMLYHFEERHPPAGPETK